MKLPLIPAFALLLLAMPPATPAATRQGPGRGDAVTSSPAQLRALGERLRQLKIQSDDAAGAAALVPLEEQPFAADPELKGHWAVLQLASNMVGLTAVWTFEPLPGDDNATAATAATIRVPLTPPGTQPVVLAPGVWRATLLVGRPGGGAWLRRPARRLELRDQRTYRLALTSDVEQELTGELRAQEQPVATPAGRGTAPLAAPAGRSGLR